MNIPFAPANAGTVNISVSASSQRVQVSTAGNPQAVYVHNDGTATVWLAWGGSSVVASASTGFPVGAGAEQVLTLDSGGQGALYIAVIAAASTGSIYFNASPVGGL